MTAGSKLSTATIKTIWQETPTVKGIQLALVSLHILLTGGEKGGGTLLALAAHESLRHLLGTKSG